MHCEPVEYKIADLVSAWKNGSLKINSEYQRGASWKTPQKQGLIDSVFRSYPLPPLFLHRITETGLGGNSTVRFEVVDGQQRLRAFADFFADKFGLLKADDKHLRLPNSLRHSPAAWGGRLYSQLDSTQRSSLDNELVRAFVVTEVGNPDEIRDLFIRLQSGTALNRQQVRDAWPGNIGPFIESLAGKLDREPSVQLFGLIDRRSDKGDDDIDRFTVNRQVCAQLLTLFIARAKDPMATQSIGADELDRLYHSFTDFDTSSGLAESFKKTVELTTQVFRRTSELANKSARNKTKYKKADVLAVFSLLQDLGSNPHFKFDNTIRDAIARHILDTPPIAAQGRSGSGRAISLYYEEWRRKLPDKLGVRLDPQRLFNETQKQDILSRDQGKCQICGNAVGVGDAEYDHYPVPHYLGGETKIDNGRLVCSKCHPRGRPAHS